MLGLRGLLLIVAAILFLIAVFSDLHQGDFIALGLLATVCAFIVEELGVNMTFGSRRT
jgi:hypothetical protein